MQTDTHSWRPSTGGIVTLAIVGAASLAFSLYARYGVIEPSSVGLVCDAGAQTTLCIARRVFIGIHMHYGFGAAALVFAVLALIRPGIVLLSLALALGLVGVVNYNAPLAGIALSLLPLALARPAPPREFQPD